MWFDILQIFLLAQNEAEKRITYFGLIFLGFFIFVLVLDAFSKGKLISTKGPLKKILIALLVIVLLAIIFVNYIYK